MFIDEYVNLNVKDNYYLRVKNNFHVLFVKSHYTCLPIVKNIINYLGYT